MRLSNKRNCIDCSKVVIVSDKITMGTIIFNDPEREYQKMKLRQEKGIRLDNMNTAERLAVDKELDDEITRRENFKAQREALKGGA